MIVRYNKSQPWWKPTGEMSITDIAIAIFALAGVGIALCNYLATERYVKVTAETFQAQFRPYLNMRRLEEGKPFIQPDPGHRRICIAFALKNNGSVPAYRVHAQASGSIVGDVGQTSFHRAFVPPHELQGLMYCSRDNIATYDSTVAALGDRRANVAITMKVQVSYEGVRRKRYEYYADCSYNNQVQSFEILDEDESEEPTASGK